MKIKHAITPFQVSLKPTPGHLVITLTGEEDSGSPRPRLGIVPVVDRSGSMGLGRKLSTVVESIRYLSTYLSEDDQVALVSFDDEVTTDLAPLPAGSEGMQALNSVLDRLTPGGSTDLHTGIRHGLAAAETIRERLGEAGVVRVIVLTDGRANYGPCAPEDFLALVGDLPAQVSVSFVGVGADCDHDLLGRLAEAGGGSYGFVENVERAADVLGAEIGGLVSLDASGVSVEVRPRSKLVRIATPLAEKSSAIVENGTVVGWRVQVGNILAGQDRHVVLPLESRPQKHAHARAVTVCDVKVTGMSSDTPLEEVVLPKAHFRPEVGDVDPDLLEVCELAELAQAQRDAEAEARTGNYRGARQVLENLDLQSVNAQVLMNAAVTNYADQQNYAKSAVHRRSAIAMYNGTLSGSSDQFDALAARTIGSYTTTSQREVANDTSQVVRSRLGQPAGAAGSAPDLSVPRNASSPRGKVTYSAGRSIPPAPAPETNEKDVEDKK